MDTGMLWFNNSSEALETKIVKAKEYFQEKYGKTADYAEVSPKDVPEHCQVGGVEVQPVRYVMKGHMWIGRKED